MFIILQKLYINKTEQKITVFIPADTLSSHISDFPRRVRVHDLPLINHAPSIIYPLDHKQWRPTLRTWNRYVNPWDLPQIACGKRRWFVMIKYENLNIKKNVIS